MTRKSPLPKKTNQTSSSIVGITSLTNNESKVLNYIEAETLRTGISPSYQEICNEFGFASYNSVQNYVKQLSKKGYLRVHPHQKRGLEVLRSATAFQAKLMKQVSSPTSRDDSHGGLHPIPLLGSVAAGAPIERLTENESLSVPVQIMRDPDQSFALCVSGDSMIEEGIHDKDWIIVLKKESAKSGDLVVASIDGEAGQEATVKRIYFHSKSSPDKRIELRPSNAKLTSQWYRDDQVQIKGLVTGLMRKF